MSCDAHQAAIDEKPPILIPHENATPVDLKPSGVIIDCIPDDPVMLDKLRKHADWHRKMIREIWRSCRVKEPATCKYSDGVIIDALPPMDG